MVHVAFIPRIERLLRIVARSSKFREDAYPGKLDRDVLIGQSYAQEKSLRFPVQGSM